MHPINHCHLPSTRKALTPSHAKDSHIPPLIIKKQLADTLSAELPVCGPEVPPWIPHSYSTGRKGAKQPSAGNPAVPVGRGTAIPQLEKPRGAGLGAVRKCSSLSPCTALPAHQACTYISCQRPALREPAVLFSYTSTVQVCNEEQF